MSRSSSRSRHLAGVAAAATLGALALGTAGAASAAPGASAPSQFTAASGVRPLVTLSGAAKADARGGLRAPAAVDNSALDRGRSATVSVELAPGRTEIADLTPMPDVAGSPTWTGTLRGSTSTVDVAKVDGQTTALFSTTTGSYRLTSDGATSTLTKVKQRPDNDVVLHGAEGADTHAHGTQTATGGGADAATGADGPGIDIVVGWTPQAAQQWTAAGNGSIAALATLSVTTTNNTYARSGVTARLNLVGTGQGVGTESANYPTAQLLEELRIPNDGKWDNLWALKESKKADLLSILSYDNMSTCGVAYYPTSGGAYGVSVVVTGCAVDNLSFPHEIGHNLGASHDRYVENGAGKTGLNGFMGAYGYGYSYINTASPTTSWRTTMAYNNECYDKLPSQYYGCERLGYISNPAVKNAADGRATGIAEPSTIAANNAKAINANTNLVANYRQGGPANAGIRGDWTGEGFVDLLGRNTNGNLYLYRGNGTGSVGASSQVDGAWGGYNYLGSPGDITGDKRTDLIGRNAAGTMYVFPGLGDGKLGPARQIGSSWGAMNILATPGDMDLDGRPDLVARRMDNTLHSYTFRADGSMRYVAQIGTGWGQMKWIIGMGDLDGDKRGDVVGVNRTDGCLYAYNTKVVGGLPRLTLKGKVGCGWNVMTWLTSSGDFNRDGYGDLTARSSDGSLWFYRGRAGGGVYNGVKVGTGWTGMAQIL